MTISNQVWWPAVAVVVAAAASACGNPPTAAVSGTVTDTSGKPVTGLILFMPQDGAKYREAAEAPIVNGRSDLPTVSTGAKRVSVIVTRNGVSDPSLDVTATPNGADLRPGAQVLDVTVSKLWGVRARTDAFRDYLGTLREWGSRGAPPVLSASVFQKPAWGPRSPARSTTPGTRAETLVPQTARPGGWAYPPLSTSSAPSARSIPASS
ncbi:MAG TPA: hypothetical protein VGE74_29885 [Gemmata sp.]